MKQLLCVPCGKFYSREIILIVWRKACVVCAFDPGFELFSVYSLPVKTNLADRPVCISRQSKSIAFMLSFCNQKPPEASYFCIPFEQNEQYR